jgi:hypothetical protein
LVRLKTRISQDIVPVQYFSIGIEVSGRVKGIRSPSFYALPSFHARLLDIAEDTPPSLTKTQLKI